MAAKLKIKQVRSTIGRLKSQKRTLEALGIRKMNGEAIHTDTPVIRGMINKVSHLVTVENVSGE